MEPSEAWRYGFTWPGERTDLTVTRTYSVRRRQKDVADYRVVALETDRDGVHVYVSPTGLIRVFRAGRELRCTS